MIVLSAYAIKKGRAAYKRHKDEKMQQQKVADETHIVDPSEEIIDKEVQVDSPTNTSLRPSHDSRRPHSADLTRAPLAELAVPLPEVSSTIQQQNASIPQRPVSAHEQRSSAQRSSQHYSPIARDPYTDTHPIPTQPEDPPSYDVASLDSPHSKTSYQAFLAQSQTQALRDSQNLDHHCPECERMYFHAMQHYHQGHQHQHQHAQTLPYSYPYNPYAFANPNFYPPPQAWQYPPAQMLGAEIVRSPSASTSHPYPPRPELLNPGDAFTHDMAKIESGPPPARHPAHVLRADIVRSPSMTTSSKDTPPPAAPVFPSLAELGAPTNFTNNMAKSEHSPTSTTSPATSSSVYSDAASSAATEEMLESPIVFKMHPPQEQEKEVREGAKEGKEEDEKRPVELPA